MGQECGLLFHIPGHPPAALIGLGVSALCLLLFGKDNFLLAAMVLICIWLCAIRKRLRQKEALK